MKMKIFAGITAVLMVSSSLGMTASATTIYGDVNNDNIISLSDIVCLNRYLKGISHKSTINVKYSDVDKNAVLDVCDVKTLSSYIAHTVSALPYSESSATFNYSSYDVSSDSTRHYKKYDCSTHSSNTYLLPTVSSPSTLAGDYDDTMVDSDANAQCIVKLAYTKSDGLPYTATGFIVSDHVIATAAHCIYNNSDFNTDYKVMVYNTTGDAVIATYDAKELHVPESYTINATESYDYGLVYVEEDLSAYGTMALGVATNKFPYTAQTVYVSGFIGLRQDDGIATDRYYGAGNITLNSVTNNSYKLYYTSYANHGDSGGPVYLEYTLNGEIFRSAVAIHTHGAESHTVHSGVKITQPLLRFYNSNPNIG